MYEMTEEEFKKSKCPILFCPNCKCGLLIKDTWEEEIE